MNLIVFNPWWAEKTVPSRLIGRRREVFDHINKYFGAKQILILYGLRRVGKTTLMFQLMEDLLKTAHVNPLHVLYFSFDEARYDLEDILAAYERDVLRSRLDRLDKVYVFLDEIQKLAGWADKVKLVYDRYPNIKLVLSGSVAINLRHNSKESLAGRFFEFLISPLSFDEFLEFKGLEIDKDREALFEVELRRELDSYLACGGFIEALNFDDEALKKYFKESLLERIAYKDLPEMFALDSPELLMRLATITAYSPGLYLDYKNIGSDLRRDQRTIAAYFSYLENALLLKKLYNFSPNLLTSEKKMKKVYLAVTAFTLALWPNADKPKVLEQYFVNQLSCRFFLRTPQREEIDIILEAPREKIVPVEIKIRAGIKKSDLKPMLKFMGKHSLKRGMVITENTDGAFSAGAGEIKMIPYWKHWTIRRELEATGARLTK